MFLTRVLNAATSKSKYVIIEVESVVSGHKFETIRLRKEEKREMIWYDPLVRRSVVYVETKKVKGKERCPDYEPPKIIEVEKLGPVDRYDP